MPIYDYKCGNCRYMLSEEREMSKASELPKCVKCAKTMQRIYNFGSVSFKGSGFYSTDK